MQIKKGITVKPLTAAQTDAACRRTYSEFDRDVRAFGRDTAIYNAGFTAGWDDAAESATRGRKWLEKLGAAIKGTWSPQMRRAWERSHAALRSAAVD
jgi:hypothetical protein